MFCGWDFYRRLIVQSSMCSSYCYVASVFLKFGEVIVEYFVFYYLWSFFYSSQKWAMRWRTSIKISQAINWMRKNLNTLNWARESKKCSPSSNCPLGTVLSGSASYILMKPSDTSMINPVFQTKSWVTNKKMMLSFLLFWRVKIRNLHHPNHLNMKALCDSYNLLILSFKS